MKREKVCQCGRFVIILILVTALFQWGCAKNEENAGRHDAKEGTEKAGTAAPAPEATAGPVPHVEFESSTFDFGEVDQGKDVVHAFKFKNSGQGNLIITKVQSSCGCTAALASSEKIGPGAEGVIEATFSTGGYQGKVSKSIRVKTNDPTAANTILRLVGTILTDVMAKPRSLNFGTLSRNTTAERDIEVTFALDEEIEIEKVECPSKQFTTAVKAFGGERGRGATITVRTGKDLPLGRIKDKLVIYTSSSKNPTLDVPIYAFIQGDIAVSPMVLSFRPPREGGIAEKSLTVSTSEAPFEILGIEVEETLFLSELETVTPGKEYKLKITLRDGVSDGRIHEALLIRTDSLEQPEIRVPIYGIIGKGASIDGASGKGPDARRMPAPRGIEPRLFRPKDVEITDIPPESDGSRGPKRPKTESDPLQP